jgi:NAD(P)H dehydrogenase (quinone)
VKVLVIGVTGELGRQVAASLVARAGVEVRAFVRRPLPADGPTVDEVVIGDLADRAALAAACAGVTRMFLVSSPTRDQVELETNAIEAAEAAGVERIVKVSNIPIAGLDTGLHGNHRAIERRLAASSCAVTVLQPSFFSSVIDKQGDVVARGAVVLPTGPGKIAWIDPVDIADVAAEALVRDDLAGPLHLTGPDALDGDEVAARLGVQRIDLPLDRWRETVVASGLDPWLADSSVHLFEAVARGALGETTGTVERVLGRPPKRVFDSGVFD